MRSAKEAQKIQDARLAYELARGTRCSDSHWWRTRQLMKRHKLEVNIKNAQLLAELREKVSKSALGIDGILDAYQKVDELLGKARGTFTGTEAMQMLLRYGVNAHQSTVSRWFKKYAGGFKKSREYKPEQLRDILIAAFLYKAQNSTKLPQAN